MALVFVFLVAIQSYLPEQYGGGTALAGMVSTRQSKSAGGEAALSVVIDDAKLTAFLQELAPQIERKPRDARFNYNEKTGKLTPSLNHIGQGRNPDNISRKPHSRPLRWYVLPVSAIG